MTYSTLGHLEQKKCSLSDIITHTHVDAVATIKFTTETINLLQRLILLSMKN